ncbi:hypothetical protein WN55_04202 [Dufourea novaeangliae]|uniref:Uncharacterized protein n=1 Tax=Dufourea novaeangliae TaxID=178035 RepID=A0A154PKE4_DUFNO|nr:hypothetical protein WN55_04202 [Dufourea novaeangliae]
MSPASQGGVEVERYIGSCLISSNLRSASHKPIVGKKDPVSRGKSRGCYTGQNFTNDQVQYGPGGWAGAPLISMTSSPRRCNQRSSPSLLQQQQQQPQQQQQQQQQTCDQQVSTHLTKNPLSRLAIHTQGAPLILTGRFHNRGKVHNSGNGNGITNAVCSGTSVNSYVHGNGNGTTNGTMNSTARCPSRSQRPELPKKQQASPKSDCSNKESSGTNNIANIDSLSIASDESSGSNNSENSLPRIIKPRKRRKKDRKPSNNVTVGDVTKHEEQQQQQQQSGSTVVSEPNVVSLKPYMPGCYEAAPQLRNHRRPPVARESVYGCRAQTTGMSMQEITDVRQRYAHRHVEVKVLDDNRNVVVPVQIRTVPKGYSRHGAHHMGVPRYLHEYNLVGCEDGIKDGLGSSCQCRYCDPSGLIWDVDQNCYSPFLTPTTEFCSNHFSHVPLFLSRPTLGCQGQSMEKLLSDNLAHHEKNAGTSVVLRRSWSDPSSYFSEEIAAPSKDVGVIGDRGQTESGKRRTLWRGDSIGIPTNGVGSSRPGLNGTISSPKGLEVSTEIITSPNGHRDLEIKFYSPSPNTPAPEEDKLIFAEEVDEDEEAFSDIWSYHESKLQQDFRTLLQAEE